jgi:very-short-patch-repair endonuclease
VHEYLSWPTILPDLEHLASAPPELLPVERGDIFDPRPWNEAFEAGVGSPLELKFLRLFEQHGVDVEKQVPVAPNEGDSPISVADFAVIGTRTAIYVDGAAFHRGERLRRDRIIRRRLSEGNTGWRVVELQASDLRNPAAMIDKIQ